LNTNKLKQKIVFHPIVLGIFITHDVQHEKLKLSPKRKSSIFQPPTSSMVTQTPTK
jgi:hypothetical protein